MTRLLRASWLAAGTLAIIGLLAPSATAQLIQGGIDGLVTDTTDAAIVGAEVTITNEDTGQVRETTTGAAGNYSFATVNTGNYTVTVRSDGFQAATTTGVVVSQNNVTRVNASLEIGQVTEVVTVEASAATLQTDRAEVRQEVTETTLRNVPVPLGRNYQMLFVTLPGFSPPQNAHSVPTNPTRAVRFSVNGTSRSNNNTRIDGASSTNIWVPHMTGYNPALESIETVNVVTNSFDAEQGLAGGAAINLQIKSGTNEVHGSAFEYHMNQHLKAYPFFSNRGAPQPKLINNQFGGTVGGPIKRNKWFYFLSYEGTTSRGSAAVHRHADERDAVRRSIGISYADLRSPDRDSGHDRFRLRSGSRTIPWEHGAKESDRLWRVGNDSRPGIPRSQQCRQSVGR